MKRATFPDCVRIGQLFEAGQDNRMEQTYMNLPDCDCSKLEKKVQLIEKAYEHALHQIERAYDREVFPEVTNAEVVANPSSGNVSCMYATGSRKAVELIRYEVAKYLKDHGSER